MRRRHEDKVRHPHDRNQQEKDPKDPREVCQGAEVLSVVTDDCDAEDDSMPASQRRNRRDNQGGQKVLVLVLVLVLALGCHC